MKKIKTSDIPDLTELGIGKTIKRLRKIHGLTQGNLGDKIGVSRQQIQKYEIGKDNVPIPRLRAISNVFDIHIGEFFPIEKPKTPQRDSSLPEVIEKTYTAMAAVQNMLRAYNKL